MESNNEVKYAGFMTRLLVFLADIFVVSFLIYSINTVISIEKYPIAILLIWWIYTAFMISKWQTTIGGKVLGIKIVNIELTSLTFLKASIRFIVSILPFVVYSYVRGMQHIMDVAPSPTVQMLPQLIFILLPFVMFFSKKRQMIHDMVVKSIVIDINKTIKKDDVAGNRVVPLGRTILRIVGGLLFLIVFGYVFMYTSVFYMLGKHSANNYNASFRTKYQVNDLNDTKIIFYRKELEKHSKEFIDAEGMYDIFAADTKKDLALNCIQASLKEHNVSDWIEAGSDFRKNARNKYADTEEKIKKAKRNESYMGHHFYDYDMNDVNEIENDIASIWDAKKNKKTCDNLVPVSELFDAFMVRYIPNREDALRSYKQSYSYAKPTGVTNKSFYKREIEKTTQWVNTLRIKYPNIEQAVQALKERQSLEAQKLREHKKKEADARKLELIWLAAEKNNLYGKRHYKKVDLNLRNDKGQTPLMIAVQRGFIKVVEEFSKGNIDISLKDNQGKTAFDYISIAKNKNEQIRNEKLLELLRIIEIKQLIRGKAYIAESVFDANSTVLKIVIAGGKCKDFTFPENTDCKEKKKRINHPIFAAIKSKDNAQFDRYLKEVNIDIEDPWKDTLLWTALLWRNTYAIDKLLSMGVDINQLDNMKKRTPLQNAVIDKNVVVLKILVKHGIETKSTDSVSIEKMKKLLKGDAK